MKRESVNTALLIVCVGLSAFLVFAADTKPSIHEIDDRVQYWFEYYRARDRAVQRAPIGSANLSHHASTPDDTDVSREEGVPPVESPGNMPAAIEPDDTADAAIPPVGPLE
jgi:hypothetical protein